MIERYARPEMKIMWSEEAKYNSWAEVEKAHLQTLIEFNQAPQESLNLFETVVQQKTVQDYLQREQETNHDVIAFVAEVGDAMGDQGHFLHKGLTSSDVVDTSLSLRIKTCLSLLIENLFQLRQSLAQKCFEHAQTICIGRTHGVHAEPLSFGQVLSNHFCEFQRAHLNLLKAQEVINYGKLSGAVGSYSQMSPEFEASVLKKLTLKPETVATQIIPRDRLLFVGHALLSCAQAVERLCTNIRHWARTELGEVLEPFNKKQKGSSAMPHKKNPIFAENLCGLARTVRGYFSILCENGALWHERDISHSSVERIALPDLFITTDFMLARTCYLIQNMEIHPKAMENNLWKTGGLWASQSVLTALVTHGLNRTEAYELVQKIALPLSERVVTGSLPQREFLNKLIENQKILDILGEKALVSLFEPQRYLESVPVVFKRAFGIEPEEYAQKHSQPISEKVPVLHKIVEVTVDCMPEEAEMLNCESKTLRPHFKSPQAKVLNLRQQKRFLIHLPSHALMSEIEKYVQDLLQNTTLEQMHIEVIQ